MLSFDSSILTTSAKLWEVERKKNIRLLKEGTYFYILYNILSDEQEPLPNLQAVKIPLWGSSVLKQSGLAKYLRCRCPLHCSNSARSTIL